MMSDNPTTELRFRWPWRPYQRRVLDVVERHLDDGRLHIVAAPGAGKTTLGLEVFRRLGRPALVLAPTLTIRNQWIRRLDDFLPEASGADVRVASEGSGGASGSGLPWVSAELRTPAFLTVATYQAVLMKSRDDEAAAPTPDDEAELAELLRSAAVGTLILDEAHHLKRAWWRALARIVSQLEGLRLVSLTGTPPYDATGHEWKRYEELCGPIDEEISVPELVRAGTLCPHQDYLFAVAPLEAEQRSVRDHDAAVEDLLAELVDDPRLQAWVDAHAWLGAEPPIVDVLDEPELAVALLAFQRATAGVVSPSLLQALDLQGDEVPPLDRQRWELLLRELLYGSTSAVDAELRRGVAQELRTRDLLFRRSLRIVHSPETERALATSGAKVRACVTINESERAVRGDRLRQVFLLDYIRAESRHDPPGAGRPELGAFPVFDALRGEDVVLVTGRMTCVHDSTLSSLAAALEVDSVPTAPLEHRPGWHVVNGVPTGRLVTAVTSLVSEGAVRVVVGTRALLGEGWDAPAVNSVVLASYVGAFVSTNQMRGRAIRTDPSRADKVASVWHLVALMPDAPTGFLDMTRLHERFETFVGLSRDGSVIESGIDRLAPRRLDQPADIEPFNADFRGRLDGLPDVAHRWRGAIDRSELGQVVPTVSFRKPPTLRPFQLARTLRYVLIELGWSTLFAAGAVAHNVLGRGTEAIMIGAGMPLILLAPKLFRAARLAVLHAPVDGSVRRIALAVFEALRETGMLEGEGRGVHVQRESDGSVQVSLDGGSFRDQSTFVTAVAEVLGPIENPRYLVTRPMSGILGRRMDYHAVPTVLGARREQADAFLRAWIRNVGVGELIFTRREGGRARLLAARGRAFANQLADPGERVDRWR